ncbi:hypothetical protein F5Y00DRAFT_226790 [Daldinia vernicosa]|uniref:uncharacterized protein n=1 Tax=Daldinia vernicosa TaxID=114800 RepID=UPI002007C9CB|nr:uncharacterized protein F5Y00DRAFT_226790 [Daldinia vernicosa]KAI0852500.1 hypothetical protein F5Y00DRAFT_226790 [Daldinia vernicosa]
MPSPNLTTIPLEILVWIASYFNGRDLKAARLVCRQLDVSLFQKFAQKYFTKVRCTCTEYSLKALVDISESRLSPYLKHVVIEADLLHYEQINADWGYYGITAGSTEVQVSGNRFTQWTADQLSFLNTGLDQQYLTKAFRNLKLERVGLCDSDQISSSSVCNCASHKGISLGTSQVYTETDASPHLQQMEPTGMHRPQEAVRCVQSVLFALGESRSRPRRLDICLMYTLLPDQAFNVPNFAKDIILPMISGLETIDLHLGLYSSFPQLISPNNGVPVIIGTYYLRTFLSHATHLEALHFKAMDLEDLSDWLGAPISYNDYEGPPELKPPNTPALTKVHECEFKGCKLPLQSLLHITRKCSGLRKLTLTNIIFAEANDDMFCRLFMEILESSAHLESIHLYNIKYAHGAVTVYFGKRDYRSRLFFYQGLNVKAELEALGWWMERAEPYTDDEYGGLGSEEDEDLDSEED